MTMHSADDPDIRVIAGVMQKLVQGTNRVLA